MGLAGLALALVAPVAAAAQPAPDKADAAAIAVPDLRFQPTESDQRDFGKYFYFHKPGVSFEAARADLTECRGYSQNLGLFPKIPANVPINANFIEQTYEDPPGNLRVAEVDPYTIPGAIAYTVVEAGIGALVIPGEINKRVVANMRKCMGFKAYKRYGLSRDLWRQLNQGGLEQALLMQAKIASGPEPTQDSLDP